MSSAEEKNKIIRQVYYDVETGFSSAADIFKQAKKILNAISVNDVKQFLEKQKVIFKKI